MSKANKATALAPAPAAAPLPAPAQIDFAADAGVGMENADRDSFAIPFIAILQPNSPAVVDTGARAGTFINTVTNECFEEALMVPCAYQRRWLRWGAREAGGGFKGELTTAEANALRERGVVKELENRLYFPLDDGSINPKRCDRLSDTRSHFVLLVPSADAEYGAQAVFALTSTGIKVSKNWMARMDAVKIKSGDRMVTAPTFSQVYRVRTEKRSNDKGTWFQPIVEPVGQVANAALYAQARAFHALVAAGKADVAHDAMRSADEGAAPQGGDGF